MLFFYNLGIRLYYLLALIISAFNKKAALWIKGRKNTFEILKNFDAKKNTVIWFHVSSLGEFEQGRPIIEALKKKNPDYQILLSFFSPSGYEIRKNYDNANAICYIPLDTKRNAKRFIKYVQPQIAVFVKYDFWYHHIKQVKKQKATLILASGIFRKEQVFFKSYGGWYRKILNQFDHLFVQDQQSIDLLNGVGIKNCTIAGDTRFDRVVEIASDSKEIEIVKTFTEDCKSIVCGSTWPADECLLIEYLQQTKHNVKLVLAPHEIHEAHIENIINQIKIPFVRFSEAKDHELSKARILIIDNIGMLSSIYKYGQLAYIGGGFGTGIHNTLEAAVYGVPVIFGPKYEKFREAIGLIDAKAATSINNYEELKTILDNYLNDKNKIIQAGSASNKYVIDNTGATKSIVDYLEKK